VDKPRTVKAMREFLKNHFRYHTMNSWNNSTSYARKVKLDHVIDDHALCMKAYDFLEVREAFYGIDEIIADFARKHDYSWQIGFNGRSSGFLVLYQGGKKETTYKTRCDTCGKPTWYETEQPCHMGNCDGTLKKITTPIFQVFTQPGNGFDHGEDYDALDRSELQWRVDIVWDFDKTVDACIKSFTDFVKSHTAEDTTVMVPKQIKVAVPV
jgi:hypothetical protein